MTNKLLAQNGPKPNRNSREAFNLFQAKGERGRESEREQEPDLNDDLDNDLVNHNECSAKEMRSICEQMWENKSCEYL